MSLPAPARETTVLITGASSGIGAELARELVGRGHHVTLVARRRDRLEALAQELGAASVAIEEADLGDVESRTRLIEKLLGAPKRVVGLCNNAGYGLFGRLDRADLEDERAMVELNVDAVHHFTGAFLPAMVGQREGAILNVASTAAYQPLPGSATYAATKAFVHSFSEAVHSEVSHLGVSVTSLCPGPTKTEFGERAGAGNLEEAAPDAILQTAAEVAQAAVRGMEEGRRTVVPGFTNKASAWGGRFVPRTVLLPVMRRLAERGGS